LWSYRHSVGSTGMYLPCCNAPDPTWMNASKSSKSIKMSVANLVIPLHPFEYFNVSHFSRPYLCARFRKARSCLMHVGMILPTCEIKCFITRPVSARQECRRNVSIDMQSTMLHICSCSDLRPTCPIACSSRRPAGRLAASIHGVI